MKETSEVTGELASEAPDVHQMVGFILNGALFGVDIFMVQEIIKQMPITGIPDSPDFIEGVINLRGDIIPVIHLHKRLNLPAEDHPDRKGSWTMIINVGGRVAGFLVDRVTRVLKVPEDTIQPAREMVLSALKHHYVRGVCELDEQLITILDFNRILDVNEFKRWRTG
ncbi:MAG: chemotaxis protein CheW [Desulfatitalea sp.]|nr:chemotaxis protein CheW [Desulfatitalea sp.]NNK01726.1 chemotaxis protein CheW [Desulfatitalea sp.]